MKKKIIIITISYSYEIFNEIVIWGLINFKELQNAIYTETQIHGTKISFDRDEFINYQKKIIFNIVTCKKY